jgi:hypothetical protein
MEIVAGLKPEEKYQFVNCRLVFLEGLNRLKDEYP